MCGGSQITRVKGRGVEDISEDIEVAQERDWERNYRVQWIIMSHTQVSSNVKRGKGRDDRYLSTQGSILPWNFAMHFCGVPLRFVF